MPPYRMQYMKLYMKPYTMRYMMLCNPKYKKPYSRLCIPLYTHLYMWYNHRCTSCSRYTLCMPLRMGHKTPHRQ